MRRPSSSLITLAILSLACQAAAPRPQAEPTPPPKPNILFILTDDMDTYDLAFMPIVKAQITDHGENFRNMFVTDPVCCPSRASFLTGQYVHNHGVLDNKPPIGGYKKFVENGGESSSVGLWMKAAGYRTGLIGKFMNRYPAGNDPAHVPPGWDDWHAIFFPESYETYWINENGHTQPYGDKEEDYLTDVLASQALDFVRHAQGKPFFLYLAPFAPHAPAQPATRHENLFPGLQAPRPPSFNEDDIRGKPAWVRVMGKMDEKTIKATDDWHRRRVQTLQAVDEMVGRLVEDLKERHQLDNTYIFFTSDNGFQLGAHRLDHGKGDPYEESIRVPLVVRGPRVPPGRSVDHMVLNIDFAPTFVALGGGTPPESVDGRSFVPLLGEDPPSAAEWRTDFLVEHWDSGKARQRETEDDGGIPEYKALRTTDWVYVEYPATGERELYDLRHDPYEMENTVKSARPGLLKRLQERLSVLGSCRGAACRQ